MTLEVYNLGFQSRKRTTLKFQTAKAFGKWPNFLELNLVHIEPPKPLNGDHNQIVLIVAVFSSFYMQLSKTIIFHH